MDLDRFHDGVNCRDFKKQLPLILAVEDDEDNRLLLQSSITMFGYQCLVAKDALEGWFLAQKYQPDLIIIDIGLPEINGLELVSEIRQTKTNQNVPILAVTAFVSQKEQELILAEGCDDHLSKPYLLEDLRAKIGSHLQVKHTESQVDMLGNPI